MSKKVGQTHLSSSLITKLSNVQNSDTPSALRIRENQRRSRNRRKELIEDLQGRLNEYERKGVEATQDMQRAARKVALENTRLQNLLTRHGVSREEVEAYLQSFDETEAPRDTSADTAMIPAHYYNEVTVYTQSPVPHAVHFQNNYPSAGPGTINIINNIGSIRPSESRNTNCTIIAPQPKPLEPIAIPPTRMAEPLPQQPTNNHHEAQSTCTPDEPGCPTTSECFCPPTATPKVRSLGTGLEISCETAATIIVEMRGDGNVDIESIRASLGCKGREECSVKNSKVLQIMDEGA